MSNSYREFPDANGLSGRKTGRKTPKKEERLNLVISADTKLRAKSMAFRAKLSLSSMIEKLLNSREADVFIDRIE